MKKITPLIILLLILTTFSCTHSPSEKEKLIENAQKYLPIAADQQLIVQEIEEKEKSFNPEYRSLKIYRDASANRYHSTMVGMEVHPVRETARYAVDLLASGVPEYQERAFAVIEAVISAQDQDTTRDTYGIWPYNFEESLDAMNKPDWNWADFIGVQLLEAYMKYYDILPDALKEKMKASLIHASRSIQKRDVKPGYTNIAIMGTLVTHLTAHLFDVPDLKDYADIRMKRFYDYTKDLGGFAEYNSPTYTRVALDELVRMKEYILDPSTLEMVDYCYRVGWEVLATHFHPPTGQLAGPHSRSYSTLLSEDFYNILYGASDKTVTIGSPKMPKNYYSLQHSIPEDLRHFFQEISTNRVEIDTFSFDENPIVGYTYLTPEYCVGTANRSTTWQQRRPYLAYWGNTENPHYLRVRLLHDFEDFGIGNIFSVQEKNKLLTALNFATNGGDYHISIDRLPAGKFKAKDIRLRFEMADASLLEQIKMTEDDFVLTDGPVNLHLDMLYAAFDDMKIKVEKGSDSATCWVDYIIYSGKNKDFDLTEIEKAGFAWNTQISDVPEAQELPEVKEEKNYLLVKQGTMQLSIPIVPGLEEALQSSATF